MVYELRRKLLKACIESAIIVQISERGFLSATDIIAVLRKRFEIQLSPGTVYPVLDKLEKEGKIEKLPNRRKRLYVLTSKGRETSESIGEKIGEINDFVTMLIKPPDEVNR